jgi:glutathione S-transferase
MITLYQFHPSFGIPNASPFCLKLETYLRMTGQPYRCKYSEDLSKAPKGKMPYIEDQGQIIADSNLVIEYLKETYGDPLDGHLAPVDLAISLAMRRLIDENLYWALVYTRWEEEAAWQVLKKAYFGNLPPIVRNIVPVIARKSTRQSLRGHGMGRHQAAEIYRIAQADITALADFLGDKPYFMGDRPSSLDAAAYGVFANILWVPIASPLQESARQFPQLARFCQKMKENYYSDALAPTLAVPV